MRLDFLFMFFKCFSILPRLDFFMHAPRLPQWSGRSGARAAERRRSAPDRDGHDAAGRQADPLTLTDPTQATGAMRTNASRPFRFS